MIITIIIVTVIPYRYHSQDNCTCVRVNLDKAIPYNDHTKHKNKIITLRAIAVKIIMTIITFIRLARTMIPSVSHREKWKQFMTTCANIWSWHDFPFNRSASNRINPGDELIIRNDTDLTELALVWRRQLNSSDKTLLWMEMMKGRICYFQSYATDDKLYREILK